jgi:MFS family permease
MDDLVQNLVHTGIWRLVLVFFLWICGLGVMIPHINPLSIDYFASKAYGQPIECSTFDKADKPLECAQGTSSSVAWTASAAFVSNAVLGLTLVPLSGWLSDSFGRKPFILIGARPAAASRAHFLRRHAAAVHALRDWVAFTWQVALRESQCSRCPSPCLALPCPPTPPRTTLHCPSSAP